MLDGWLLIPGYFYGTFWKKPKVEQISNYLVIFHWSFFFSFIFWDQNLKVVHFNLNNIIDRMCQPNKYSLTRYLVHIYIYYYVFVVIYKLVTLKLNSVFLEAFFQLYYFFFYVRLLIICYKKANIWIYKKCIVPLSINVLKIAGFSDNFLNFATCYRGLRSFKN